MLSSLRESLRRGIACQSTSLSVDSKDRKSILASVYNRIGVGKGAHWWSLKNLLSPIYGSFFLFVCFSGVSYKKVLFWQVGGKLFWRVWWSWARMCSHGIMNSLHLLSSVFSTNTTCRIWQWPLGFSSGYHHTISCRLEGRQSNCWQQEVSVGKEKGTLSPLPSPPPLFFFPSYPSSQPFTPPTCWLQPGSHQFSFFTASPEIQGALRHAQERLFPGTTSPLSAPLRSNQFPESLRNWFPARGHQIKAISLAHGVSAYLTLAFLTLASPWWFRW